MFLKNNEIISEDWLMLLMALWQNRKTKTV